VAKFFTPKVAAHLLVNTLIPNVKDTALAIIEALANDTASPRGLNFSVASFRFV
jgi:hypothetical protein